MISAVADSAGITITVRARVLGIGEAFRRALVPDGGDKWPSDRPAMGRRPLRRGPSFACKSGLLQAMLDAVDLAIWQGAHR